MISRARRASGTGVSTSDHKPVCAHFDVQPSPIIEKLTQADAVQVGLKVKHPTRGKGEVVKIERPLDGPIMYWVTYNQDGSTHKYKPESLYKIRIDGGKKSLLSKLSRKIWGGAATSLDNVTSTGKGAREGLPCPLIRFQSIELHGLRDGDLRGGSDPYLMFLTNPGDLVSIAGDAPISTIQKAVARARIVSMASSLTSITTLSHQAHSIQVLRWCAVV